MRIPSVAGTGLALLLSLASAPGALAASGSAPGQHGACGQTTLQITVDGAKRKSSFTNVTVMPSPGQGTIPAPGTNRQAAPPPALVLSLERVDPAKSALLDQIRLSLPAIPAARKRARLDAPGTTVTFQSWSSSKPVTFKTAEGARAHGTLRFNGPIPGPGEHVCGELDLTLTTAGHKARLRGPFDALVSSGQVPMAPPPPAR